MTFALVHAGEVDRSATRGTAKILEQSFFQTSVNIAQLESVRICGQTAYPRLKQAARYRFAFRGILRANSTAT